jgi:isocitrate/isopropylmalate dehydrogenase
MLAYLGYTEQAKQLERAIEKTYHVGVSLTCDQGGRGSTMEFAEAVVESIVSMK